jgi:hypothetical protein
MFYTFITKAVLFYKNDFLGGIGIFTIDFNKIDSGSDILILVVFTIPDYSIFAGKAVFIDKSLNQLSF